MSKGKGRRVEVEGEIKKNKTYAKDSIYGIEEKEDHEQGDGDFKTLRTTRSQ